LAQGFWEPGIKLSPELIQPPNPISDLVPGDDGPVDSPDRRADHPIGLYARFMKCLVGARLIAPRRSSTLHHKHDAAWKACL
jgi:hypothetical protein